MNKQMLFPVNESGQSYNSHDYIYTECNLALREIIENLPKPSGVLPYKNAILLEAPPKSGKTHFCHLFASKTGASFLHPGDKVDNNFVIIDDIDQDWEEAELFHKFNEAHERGITILLTVSDAKKLELKDLQSRINSLRKFTIEIPDDAMIRAILVKHLSSRNINVTEDVIKFLSVRIPRNFEDIFRSIDLVDKLSLEKRRNINVSFLASILDEVISG